MIHIKRGKRAACDATLADGDTLVDAALQSTCTNCRATANVGPVNQRGCEVREAPLFVPVSHPEAPEILRHVRARRDEEDK